MLYTKCHQTYLSEVLLVAFWSRNSRQGFRFQVGQLMLSWLTRTHGTAHYHNAIWSHLVVNVVSSIGSTTAVAIFVFGRRPIHATIWKVMSRSLTINICISLTPVANSNRIDFGLKYSKMYLMFCEFVLFAWDHTYRGSDSTINDCHEDLWNGSSFLSNRTFFV